jgi:hypothetical protein
MPRRRPVAVYRVIDEAELLGESSEPPAAGAATRAAPLALADNPDADLRPRAGLPGRHRITVAIVAFGLLVLLAATLVNTTPGRHLARATHLPMARLALARTRSSKLVRLAVRAQTRITHGAQRLTRPRSRRREPRSGSLARDDRAKRPPRARPVPAPPAAPPAAAPVKARPSPASEFGFER